MKHLPKSAFTFLIARFVFLVFSFSLLLPDIALANLKDYCQLKPYLGIDAGVRRMVWDQNFGSNLFKHTVLQPNIYAGLKFNPFLGIELGYESIIFKKHDKILGVLGQQVIVVNFPFAGPAAIQSNVKLRGWHVSLIGTYPLELWNCLELLGTVGLASLKTTQQFTAFSDGDGFFDPPITRTFSKNKVVPRIAAGFQYKFTENLGLRLILLGIENTSLFNYLTPAEGGDTLVKMKHNTYHSIGITFTF